MDKYEVPCPACGSIEVVVGDRAESSSNAPVVGDEKAYVPHVRRCACRDCRHSFKHDFSFSR